MVETKRRKAISYCFIGHSSFFTEGFLSNRYWILDAGFAKKNANRFSSIKHPVSSIGLCYGIAILAPQE